MKKSKVIANESLNRIRDYMVDEYGQENISITLMEYSAFDEAKPRDFLETMEHFAKRYGVILKFK
jgi:hypothetical protein